MSPVPPLTRRHLFGLATGLGATAALAACGSGPEVRNDAAQPIDATNVKKNIRTCVYATNHASSPLYWQQFAPEGVTVDVQIVTSSADIQTALENGDLDFGMLGGYSTLLAHEQGGFSSKVVGMCARGGLGLVGNPESGIETVEDLAGKTIGVPPPGQQVIVLNLLLEAAGLSLSSDTNGIPVGYADQVIAFAGGDIDAYMGSEPPATVGIVEQGGVRVGDSFSTVVGDFNTAMFASPSVLADGPDTVRAVAEMQKQASEYLSPGGENDPAVWENLLVTQFGLSPGVYEEVLPYIGARWQFDDEREAQYRAAGDFMLSTGVITKEPDYESLFAREYWEL